MRVLLAIAGTVLGVVPLAMPFARPDAALAQATTAPGVAPTPVPSGAGPAQVMIVAQGTASRPVAWDEVRAWGLPPPRTPDEAFARARMPSTPVTALAPGAKRDRLMALAVAYLRAHPDVELPDVRFDWAGGDCAELAARARARADADAARQIEARAASTHAVLGQPVRVDAAYGCPDFPAPPGRGLPIDIDTMTVSLRIELVLWFRPAVNRSG